MTINLRERVWVLWGGIGRVLLGPTQTAFFDNVKVTVPAAGTPTINVSPISLSGFSALSGVPSAVQTYTVDGTDLTADISIAPPTGYEISPTGAFTPTNPITLTQTAGTVASTTIQVRMNSAALGVNAGNITHTSAGSNDPDVAVTGNVLAPEPTIQSTITFGAVTNSTIVVNFAGGNGANRILVAKALTAVDSDPVDGTTYTANSIFGSGTQIGTGNYVVYVGAGNTQLVSGLTAGTTYHFAVYEFNDGATAGAENYLIPGGTGNQATIDVPVIYTWIGGTGQWITATNWAPTRLFPATNDILLFLDGTTEIVTNVPNQTIGQLHVSLGTQVTLWAAVSSTALTITGSIALDDLTVDATSGLTIDSPIGYSINLATGTTGVIDGMITLKGGIHKLTSADAGGITFNSGASCTAGTGFSGNAFGSGTANSVIFTSGSVYHHVSGVILFHWVSLHQLWFFKREVYSEWNPMLRPL
ncbi:MAG: hypothetical protein IPL84_10860 [Chitinophagaceae bacterium]|nr:hypothetical protein [Chitinophagaceae bacterium]